MEQTELHAGQQPLRITDKSLLMSFRRRARLFVREHLTSGEVAEGNQLADFQRELDTKYPGKYELTAYGHARALDGGGETTHYREVVETPDTREGYRMRYIVTPVGKKDERVEIYAMALNPQGGEDSYGTNSMGSPLAPDTLPGSWGKEAFFTVGNVDRSVVGEIVRAFAHAQVTSTE